MKTLETLITETLDENIERLYNYCVDNGVRPPKKTLDSVVSTIIKFRAFNPTITYANVNIDVHGYIETIRPLEEVIDCKYPTPSDIEDGYYKLVGNKYVLCPDRKDFLYPDIDMF